MALITEEPFTKENVCLKNLFWGFFVILRVTRRREETIISNIPFFSSECRWKFSEVLGLRRSLWSEFGCFLASSLSGVQQPWEVNRLWRGRNVLLSGWTRPQGFTTQTLLLHPGLTFAGAGSADLWPQVGIPGGVFARSERAGTCVLARSLFWPGGLWPEWVPSSVSPGGGHFRLPADQPAGLTAIYERLRSSSLRSLVPSELTQFRLLSLRRLAQCVITPSRGDLRWLSLGAPLM